ncbi:MAG: hypothetical protein V4608_05760 [Bacteroidota bacterium]
MSKTIPLEPDHFYHIYNHSNGKDNLFLSEANYRYFLEKFKEYISPISETYAYCLMPNHFHFLIKLNDETSIFSWLQQNEKIADYSLNLSGFKNLSGLSIAEFNPFSAHISRQFSNFFNSYSKSLNKQENRMGSLFVKNFKRKQIITEEQLKKTLFYIHTNPVHHGFVEKITDWKYSSYHSMISDKVTQLKRNEVLDLFAGIENFKYNHQQINQNIVQELESEMQNL